MRPRHVLWIWLTCAASAAASAPEEKEYFAILLAGQKAGHAVHTRSVAGGKVTTTDDVTMVIERMGQRITVRMSETAVETVDGKPLAFSASMAASRFTQQVHGTVGPDGKVEATITLGSNSKKHAFDWPKGALMAEGLRLLGRKIGLAKGAKNTCLMFSPLLLRAVDTRVSVGPTEPVDLLGRVVPLTEFTVETPGLLAGSKSVSYVDKHFNALKIVMPVMGTSVELIACGREFAFSKNNPSDFFERVIVPSPTPIEDLQHVSQITYTLAPKGRRKLSIPSMDNQSVRDATEGKALVTVRPVAAPKGIAFPYVGDNATALAALKPTRIIQSDDNNVIALSRRAVGDTKDAAEAARRIEGFVHGYIETKDLSVGHATASEVAVSKQGDCTEHAVLTTAMCRAAGIPAQVVGGLVYVRKWGKFRNCFVPHAWSRARVGNTWVHLDATRGFTAGHIALTVGDGKVGDFFQLVNVLGEIKMTKVEVRR